MPYLIDGHNLIGQMPDISLDDPDDEAKLVMLVKRWCARQRRKATIIFDGGLPGGVSKLSNSEVTVVFASERRSTADDLLLNRIRDEGNPNGLIVVSSDQAVARAARQRRMTVKGSAEFAGSMIKDLRTTPSAEAGSSNEGLSENDVAEWEALFKRKKD
jgi:uncharacterized protein